jgi:hypothetical protein
MTMSKIDLRPGWFLIIAAIFIAKVQYTNGFNVRDLLFDVGIVLPGLIAVWRQHHQRLAICVLNTVIVAAFFFAAWNVYATAHPSLGDVLFLNKVFSLSVIVWPLALVWACFPVTKATRRHAAKASWRGGISNNRWARLKAKSDW